MKKSSEDNIHKKVTLKELTQAKFDKWEELMHLKKMVQRVQGEFNALSYEVDLRVLSTAVFERPMFLTSSDIDQLIEAADHSKGRLFEFRGLKGRKGEAFDLLLFFLKNADIQ